MGDLIAGLGGPFFEFLVCDKDEHRQRRGTVQRTVGIKPEYFRHPKALRVPDCVISLVFSCFEEAHPKFNYYGETEFYGEELGGLIDRLTTRLACIRSCTSVEEFGKYTTELFDGYCEDSIGPWREHWPLIRDQVTARIEEVLSRGKAAKEAGKVLLVLGV